VNSLLHPAVGSAVPSPFSAHELQCHLRKLLGVLGIEEGKQTSIGQNPKVGAGNGPEQVNSHLHGNEIIPVALHNQRACRNGGEKRWRKVHIVIAVLEIVKDSCQGPDLIVASLGKLAHSVEIFLSHLLRR